MLTWRWYKVFKMYASSHLHKGGPHKCKTQSPMYFLVDMIGAASRLWARTSYLKQLNPMRFWGSSQFWCFVCWKDSQSWFWLYTFTEVTIYVTTLPTWKLWLKLITFSLIWSDCKFFTNPPNWISLPFVST